MAYFSLGNWEQENTLIAFGIDPKPLRKGLAIQALCVIEFE